MGEHEQKKQQKGLLIVYTGHGKGKTTAALGMCVRAVGYDWSVCIVQFVKGSWKYGELKGIERLAPNVELHTVGEGFVGIVDDKKDLREHRAAAQKGIAFTIEKIASRRHRLIIVDELNVARKLDLVTDDDVRAIIDAVDDTQHLVITGRDAPEWLVDMADLVTEMRQVKHPFQKGILAQPGVDW